MSKLFHRLMPRQGLSAAWSPTFLVAFASVIVLTFIVTSVIIKPAMFPDSGWGFLGWDTSERAPGFNYSLGPSRADISKDETGFMAYWTPGQHIVPGFLERTGMSLGLAIVVVTSAFSVLGLIGWYTLYRGFGFPPQTSAVALLIMACSRFFSLPFGIYNGGEVLLFGVAPWFVLLTWRMRDLRWPAVLPLLGGAIVLIAAKLSGIIIAGAAICGAAASGTRAWYSRETARRLMVAAVTIGAIGVFFHLAWHIHGETPASTPADKHPAGLPLYVALVVSWLWSASFSLGDLASYILLHPARPVLRSSDAVYFAFLPVALLVLVLTFWNLRRNFGEYLRFSFVMAAAVSVFLILLWARGSSISFEERHLRIPSLVLLVGIVHVFINFPARPVRVLFALAVIGASAYGLASFTAHAKANVERPMGVRGFRQWQANAEVLAFLRKIDVVGPNGELPLVIVPSPEVGLEVRTARVTSNIHDLAPDADLRKRPWRGRVPRLYLILEKRLIDNGRVGAILSSFEDYRLNEWRMVPLGDYACFYQDQPS